MEERKVIFVGKPGKTDVKTKAYQQCDVEAATHLRLAGENTFIRIEEGIIIKRVNDDGTPGEDIHFSDMKAGEDYVYIDAKNNVYDIESMPYAEIAFMTKSEKGAGTHYRCDDGLYVRKDEIQVPAYQKVDLPEDHNLIQDTAHNGRLYIEYGAVIVDGKKIRLPHRDIVKDGNKYFYVHNGVRKECEYLKNSEEKRRINYLLIDGEQIVHASKLKQQEDGSIVVEGTDKVVGKKDAKVNRPLVEASSMVTDYEFVINSHNMDKIRPLLNQDSALIYTWPKEYPGPNGIVRIEINHSRTVAKFIYEDGRRVVYTQHGGGFTPKPDDEIHWVKGFTLTDIGEEGVRFEVKAFKKELAQNIKFEGENISSYTLGDTKITNIEWHEVGGYDEISSYVINGVKISSITWHAGEIKSCKVHLINEDSLEEVVDVANLRTSKYKDLAIKCEKIDKVENIKINEDATIDFKIGEYKFTNAVINADNTIGECVIKKGNGQEEKIDLSTDARFSHLRAVVTVAINDQSVQPLLESRLVEKRDGKYEKVADIVQAGELKNGVANAKTVSTVEEAAAEQKRFGDKPHKTWYMDEKGEIHQLNDVENEYSGTAEFDCHNDYFKTELGKMKIESKNGDLKIDATKANGARDGLMVVGFAMCSNPVTFAIGALMLMGAASVAIIAPIVRAVRKSIMKNQSLDVINERVQDNAKEKCEEEVNELQRVMAKRWAYAKKHHSTAELDAIRAQLENEAIQKMSEIAGKMQIFGQGSIKCEFDLSKKTKLTPENMIGYYACMAKRDELINGKKADPRFDGEWAKLFYAEAEDEIEAIESELTGEHKVSSKSADVFKQVEVLQQFGGRDEQIKAYNLKLKHIDKFLEEENSHRTEDNQLDKETFRYMLEREYDAGRMEWGSIDDKIEALKNSEEYSVATPKQRAEMVKEAREKLMKEANSVKVTEAEVKARYDKHGVPLADKGASSVMAFLYREILPMFDMDRPRGATKFSMDYIVKLPEHERAKYDKAISEHTARRSSSDKMRRLKYDSHRSLESVNAVDHTVQSTITEKLDRAETMLKQAKTDRNSELAYIAEVEARKARKEIAASMAQNAKKVKHEELNASKLQETKKRANKAEVRLARVDKLAERMESTFDVQTEQITQPYICAEFAKMHEAEFREYYKNLNATMADGTKISEHYLYASFMASKTKQDAQAAEQVEMLKVKHNMAENVEADVYCDEDREEYERYAQENGLDPDSVETKCGYYAKCKKERGAEVKKFKKKSKDKCLDRAAELLEEGKLTKHGKKENKLKVIKTAKSEQKQEAATEKAAESAPATAPAPEAGKVA